MKDEWRKGGGKLTALRRKNLIRAATGFSRVAAMKRIRKRKSGERTDESGILPNLADSCYGAFLGVLTMAAVVPPAIL